MEASNLKNIVVLRNLPSNIVDEAIVILKPNQKIKKPEVVENSKGVKFSKTDGSKKGYILKEAEMLVSNYISQLEKEKNSTSENRLLKKKSKRLKRYSIFSTVMLILTIVLNFI